MRTAIYACTILKITNIFIFKVLTTVYSIVQVANVQSAGQIRPTEIYIPRRIFFPKNNLWKTKKN